jgi:hypothetical protein
MHALARKDRFQNGMILPVPALPRIRRCRSIRIAHDVTATASQPGNPSQFYWVRSSTLIAEVCSTLAS